MKMKRIAALLLAAMTAGGSMTGCVGSGTGGQSQASTPPQSSAETSTAQSGEDVVLRVLSVNALFGEEAVALFESQNPGIKVDYEYVSQKDYPAKFSAMVSAGEVPDVYWSQAGFFTDQIAAGLPADLSELLKTESYEGGKKWDETFIPALLDNTRSLVKKSNPTLTTFDYGIPFTMTTIGVLYDKNVYEKLGLKQPADWAEFESNCQALKEAGYIPLSMQQNWIDWYPRLFWDQYCRDVLDANPNAFADGTMSFQDERVRKGLESFKHLWDQEYLPESGATATLESMQQLFVQGKLAQFLITPDKIEYIMDNAPEGMSLSSYVFPGIAGLPSRSLGGSSNVFCMSKTSKHPEESLRLLKFITSKTLFSSVDNLKYTNSGLLDVTSDPELAQFLTGFTDAAKNGFTPDIYVPCNLNTQINEAFKTDLLPNYLMGIYDLDYVCKELQTLYDTTVKTAK